MQVHGDFHPANMMWQRLVCDGEPLSGRLVILDWEVVGLGSGPQDLAQYLISHASPELRRSCEIQLVQEYYATLTGGESASNSMPGVSPSVVDHSGYSFEMCWAEYVAGGSERWIWLLALLSTMCPDSMNQYFHDQVGAFLRDHEVTPESIGMPRV